MSLEQVVYRAKAKATGGRDGRATSSDGVLDVKLGVPKEMGGAGGVASLVSAHQRWPRSMGEGCTKSRPEAMARFTQRGVLCMAMRLSAVMYCIK